jgi:TadE-like protein
MRKNGISERGEKGQALIEMALVLLFLSMIVFGITEYGRYFFYWNTFNNAARAAVRQAVVKPGLTPISATNCPGGAGTIVEEACRLIPGAGSLSPRPTVTVIIPNSPAQNGDRVEVRVNWTFNILSGSLIPFFKGSRPIVGDASMRYEL